VAEILIMKARATVEDLYRVPENGKAELVNGELVLMPATGALPGHAKGAISFSLDEYACNAQQGCAVASNVAFLVILPHRESFSPDAAYYIGPNPGMKFYQGAPIFAAEVRSEGDYGPQAEREMAQKRDDYFATGTLVVWDVDLLGPDVVRVYRAADPLTPMVYRRGEIAEAEPAVAGWTMPVDDLFPLGENDNP
jgi:Uma2 family endonuclease